MLFSRVLVGAVRIIRPIRESDKIYKGTRRGQTAHPHPGGKQYTVPGKSAVSLGTVPSDCVRCPERLWGTKLSPAHSPPFEREIAPAALESPSSALPRFVPE